VVLLGEMPPDMRAAIERAMSDEERARMVAVMSPDARQRLRAAIGPPMWEATLEALWRTPALAAKYLGSLPPEQAAERLEEMHTGAALAAMAAMEPRVRARARGREREEGEGWAAARMLLPTASPGPLTRRRRPSAAGH